MSAIRIHGIPSTTTATILLSAQDRLRQAMVSIPDLKCALEDVTVLFPTDLLPRDGLHLIAYVEGIVIDQPCRCALKLRETIADAVGTTILDVFVRTETVDVFVLAADAPKKDVHLKKARKNVA
jgi:hypothetical protein